MNTYNYVEPNQIKSHKPQNTPIYPGYTEEIYIFEKIAY